MRRLAVVALLVLGLAACGGSGKPTLEITFGRDGGLIAPYAVTIAPGGAITTTGNAPLHLAAISKAEDKALSNQVRDGIGNLKSSSCPGTLPDEAAQFITALGKTVRVRGNCDAGFMKLWNALTEGVMVKYPEGPS